jgi:type IV pilus assembly protein PilC
MMGVISFIMLKIVPEFEKIFWDFSTQLPTLTAMIIAAANTFAMYWYLAAPFILLLGLSAIAYLVLQTNAVVFRPVGFRYIFRSTDAAKFLRVFAVGVRHRFPIPTILERYRWTVPSNYLRNKGVKIQKSVEQGNDWIDAVCRVGFVNRPEASLLKSAQRTGNTATVLDQLAQSKERSQIRKDDLFSKMAFIPLMFLLGAIIGTLVIGMFVPLVQLITDLSY